MRLSARSRAWICAVLLISIGMAWWIGPSGRSINRAAPAAGAVVLQEQAPDVLQKANASTVRAAIDVAAPIPKLPSSARASRKKPRRALGSIKGVIQLSYEDLEAKCRVTAYKRSEIPFSSEHLSVEGGGRFTKYGERGQTVDLRVRVPGHGTAYVPDVTFDDPATVLADPVVVRGPGVLRVHVFDGEGKPTIGLNVSARHAGDDDKRKAIWLSDNGLLQGSVVTDAEGNGEIHGLAPGAYRLTARAPDVRNDWNNSSSWRMRPQIVALAPAPIPADGRVVQIQHAVPEILVRIQGRPENTHLTEQDENHLKRQPWSLKTRVEVARIDRAGGLDERDEKRIRSSDEGVLLAVVPGQRYRVYSHGGARKPHFVDVDVPQASGRITVEFELPGPSPTGTLTLLYTGPPPAPDEPGLGAPFEYFSVVLTDPDKSTFRAKSAVRRHQARTSDSFRLPIGTYTVDIGGFQMSAARPRTFSSLRETIHIRASRETTLTLESPPCAYLELFTSEEPSTADRQTPASLNAVLIHPNGNRERLVFEYQDKSPTPGVPWTPSVGEDLRTSGLGTGSYRLRVELKDRRLLEREVQLTSGITTRVELLFPPAPPLPERPVRRRW